MKRIIFITILTFCFNSHNLFAQNDTLSKKNILLRPNVNIGFLDTEYAYSYGARILLPAGDNKAYGIEFSSFNTEKTNNDFFSVGIIIEQKLFGWFNMSIGTIGYFNYGITSDNLIGLTTNLGWEPNTEKLISPFVTYRSDFIFSDKINLLNALNIGLNINL